jgi:hypothetical protein
VTGIDHDAVQTELLARLRHGIADNAPLRAALPDVARAMERHFLAAPCC